MSAACYSSEYEKNGVKAWAVWGQSSLTIWVCVLTSVPHFYSMECPFWHTLPYKVCYYMSVTTDNSMVSYLWECKSTLQVLCEEKCFCSATQNEVCSIIAYSLPTNQPTNHTYSPLVPPVKSPCSDWNQSSVKCRKAVNKLYWLGKLKLTPQLV